MSKEIQTLTVEVKDEYSLQDAASKISSRVQPRGYVEIYETDESGEDRQLVGKSNLVVYQGREWIATKIMGLENTNLGKDERTYSIYWFGLGSGGTEVNDPINAISPTNQDTNMYSSIGLRAEQDGTLGDYKTTGLPPGEDPGFFKVVFDSVEFEQDTDNDNKYLILKITTNIGVDYANGKNISEAGLFTSSTPDAEHTGPFALFSRVTFPTIIKSESRQLVFVWYIYV